MPTCYQFGCSDILYLELLSEFPSIDYKMILPPEIPGVQASKNIWFVSARMSEIPFAIRLLICLFSRVIKYTVPESQKNISSIKIIAKNYSTIQVFFNL